MLLCAVHVPVSDGAGGNHAVVGYLDAVIDKHFQILVHGHAADNGCTGTQLMKAGIHHNRIRMLCDTTDEGFLWKSITQNTAGRKNFQLVTPKRTLLSF